MVAACTLTGAQVIDAVRSIAWTTGPDGHRSGLRASSTNARFPYPFAGESRPPRALLRARLALANGHRDPTQPALHRPGGADAPTRL